MTAGIVGLGLIGGSLAKAYRAHGARVLAFDTDGAVLSFAQLDGTVDAVLTKENVSECDIVLIAVRPGAAISYLREAAPHIGARPVVIDCCGVKREVCETAFALAREHGFTFLGGHPMAGSHRAGYKNARANLFHAAPMVLVPPEGDDIALLARVKKLLAPAEFGKFSVTSAAEHDRMIAFTSQLAHIVSNAYIKSPTARSHRGFSAGSYKDLTRVAWLDPSMWAELFLDNRDNVLFELDSLAESLAQYRAAEIGYTSAASSYSDQKNILDRQVALYEKNWNDTKALFEIGAASQSEVDQMELQYLSTKAQRDSTLAQLEASMQSAKSSYEQLALAMENIDSHGNVIAPVDGVLASLTASEGGMVSPSYAVAVIDGAEQMKVTVMVSEALVPKLAIGDTVTVRVSAADAEFEGVIRSVEKTANQVTKLYTVTVTVPAEVEGLLSGMFADVTFHTAVSESAVVVPSEAILTSSDKQYVFIVENDTAKRVDITTGLTGSGMTEVTSGLDAGEQLVTVGQQYLSDGDAVRVVEG